MSASTEPALQRRALIIAAVVVGLLALFSGGDGEPALGQPPSTLLDGEGGARALFEVTRELGLDSRTWMLPTGEGEFGERVQTLAIVGAGESLTRGEARALLDWVRGGGRLFYAPVEWTVGSAPREPFLDLLGARRAPRALQAEWLAMQPPPESRSAESRVLLEDTPESVTCTIGSLDLGGVSAIPHEVLLGSGDGRAALALLRPGEGRIVLLASAAGLANSELGQSPLALGSLRALEWLADGRTLWFDEFHHGHDERVGVVQAGTRALLTTHAGWAVLALLSVVLLAIACRGVRLGPPVPERPRPGRSSLEHVEALAAGWAAARAQARPAHLLVEGLRLRLGVVHQRDLGDRLQAVAARSPALGAAVATIRQAADGEGRLPATGPAHLVPLADAIDAVLEAEGRRALPTGWDSAA